MSNQGIVLRQRDSNSKCGRRTNGGGCQGAAPPIQMSCLICNARGMGSPRAFCELSWLLTDSSPLIVFLCEIHIKTNRCTNWKNRLGFEGLFVVDPIGRKWGLMIFWKDSCEMSILSYLQGHIDCLINYEGKKWRFTGFYGNPEQSWSKFSWELIKRLNEMLVDTDPNLA